MLEAINFNSFEISNQTFEVNKDRDLGTIRLKHKVSGLTAVTVVGGQSLIENKIDKMVFNAEKDLTSQGGTVTDILKKIPQVSVDVDGNVELEGSSSIRFLIDGKPSTAFGTNITDVLQSIPASQIKSIEVITNPGAKYEGWEVSSILFLKHMMVRGINGSLSLTVASRNENGAFNLSVRNGNFGVNVFIDANGRLPATTPLTSQRISQDTTSKTKVILDQDGSSRFSRYGVQSGVSLDYSFRKKNNFTFSLSNDYFGSSNNGSQIQTETTYDYKNIPFNQILGLSQTQSDVRLHNINSSLDYKRTFEKEDQELDIGIHTSVENNRYNSVNSHYSLPGRSTTYGKFPSARSGLTLLGNLVSSNSRKIRTITRKIRMLRRISMLRNCFLHSDAITNEGGEKLIKQPLATSIVG